jgi:glycosyltransferase involved in cell wall biosynthesis
MLFSIIIPTYNRAHIISETICSVLDQQFGDYEIIVVDDGSTDNTREVVEAIKSDKISYYYKLNEERSIARNFGADQATGQYLVFLDSDDKMLINHLALVHNYLVLHQFTPSFLFTGYVIYRPDGKQLYEFSEDGIFLKTRLFYGNFLGCSSVLVKTDLFKKHYFNTDPGLILFEDWELWLRIIAENPLHCIPGKSVTMINHTGRSVLNYDYRQLISKIVFFKNHVLKNVKTVSESFRNRHTFLMGIYSYASLHIALTKKNRSAAIRYLLRSLANSPELLTKRRFFGILKQLM